MELVTPIRVDTPLGPGLAIIVELGSDDNFWTVILDNRAIVTFRQEDILAAKSYTYRRGMTTEGMKITFRRKKI